MRRAVFEWNGFDDFFRNPGLQNLQIVTVSFFCKLSRQPVETLSSLKETKFSAKEPFKWFVYVNITTFTVLHECNSWTVVHKAVEERLCLTQFVFGFFTLGEVPTNSLNTDRFAV